jgi:basic membrane protein A
MKKITSIVMVLVMAAALFAQGGQEKAAPAQAAGSDKPTIRLMTDATGIDDKSFNAAAWRGIVAFYGDTVANPKGRGTYYDVVTAQSQDMYIPNLQQAADEGYA